MNDESFKRIEQKFEISLPDWYRRQLSVHPLPETDDALYCDEEALIRVNDELRRDGWFGFAWPPEFFAIGDTGCGDFYFIVPTTQDRRIFIADHEGGLAPSRERLNQMVWSDGIEKHVEETLQMLRDVEVILERRRNKKWWQFWK